MGLRLVLIAVVISVFATVFPIIASAQGGDTPKPVPSRQLTGVFALDPTGVWRTITQTDSTSDCIGEPVTPMCAIDTYLACFIREIEELCSIASSPPPESKPSPDYYQHYRVVAVRLAKAGDIDAVPSFGPEAKRRIGDILIDVIRRSCYGSDEYCITYEMPMTYTLRHSDNRWLIINIYSPRY